MWRSYYSASLSAVSRTPEPVEKKKKNPNESELRGSAAIPIFQPVKMFFFNSASHLLTSWGNHHGSLFLTLTFTSISLIITAHSLPPLPGTFKRARVLEWIRPFRSQVAALVRQRTRWGIWLRADNRGWRVKWYICAQGNLLILRGDQPNAVTLTEATQCPSVVAQLPVWISTRRRHCLEWCRRCRKQCSSCLRLKLLGC